MLLSRVYDHVNPPHNGEEPPDDQRSSHQLENPNYKLERGSLPACKSSEDSPEAWEEEIKQTKSPVPGRGDAGQRVEEKEEEAIICT